MAGAVDKYNIKTFLSDRSVDNFCIPELQRDYVWREENINDLLQGINEEFNGQGGEYHIGFISAYRDQLNKNRYMLIDGQQRVTTMYLLLFALQLFKKPTELDKCAYLYKKSKKTPRLDYKVRDVSHIFLKKLYEYGVSLNSVNEFKIEDQRWYNHQYQQDPTVCRIISNLKVIICYLHSIENKDKFYEYVLNNVKLLFYPDDDRGFECERLYIYINGRGKKLESNETLKAMYLNEIVRGPLPNVHTSTIPKFAQKPFQIYLTAIGRLNESQNEKYIKV